MSFLENLLPATQMTCVRLFGEIKSGFPSMIFLPPPFQTQMKHADGSRKIPEGAAIDFYSDYGMGKI